MDVTITHCPLTADEAFAVISVFRKSMELKRFLLLSIGTPVLALTVFLVITQGVGSVFFLILFFVILAVVIRLGRNAQIRGLIRQMSTCGLYELEHQVQITDAGFHAETPGFSIDMDWKRVPQFVRCPIPETGDEILMLLVNGLPVLRKSDFSDAADFARVSEILQECSTEKGAR